MSGNVFMDNSDVSEEDDDDFTVAQEGKSKVLDLFIDAKSSKDGSSLRYSAPMQPNKVTEKQDLKSESSSVTSDSTPETSPTVLFATAVHAFILRESKYESVGKIGAAVLKSATNSYGILLYQSNKQAVGQLDLNAQSSITSSNKYIQFTDDSARAWSLAFDSQQSFTQFLQWVLAVCAVQWTEHHDHVMILDIEEGAGQKLSIGDMVAIDYTEYLIETGPIISEFNGNAKGEQGLRVKLGKGKVPKGWESGIVGMRKGGRRLFAIPADLGYSGHDSNTNFPTNTPLMLLVTVNKVKFSQHDQTVVESVTKDEAIKLPDEAIQCESMESLDDTVKDDHTSNIKERMSRIGHNILPDINVSPTANPLPSPELIPPVAKPRSNPMAIVCADITATTNCVTKPLISCPPQENMQSHITPAYPYPIPSSFMVAYGNNVPVCSGDSSTPYMPMYPWAYVAPPPLAEETVQQRMLLQLDKSNLLLQDSMTQLLNQHLNAFKDKVSLLDERVEFKLNQVVHEVSARAPPLSDIADRLKELKTQYTMSPSNSLDSISNSSAKGLNERLESIEAHLAQSNIWKEKYESVQKQLNAINEQDEGSIAYAQDELLNKVCDQMDVLLQQSNSFSRDQVEKMLQTAISMATGKSDIVCTKPEDSLDNMEIDKNGLKNENEKQEEC